MHILAYYYHWDRNVLWKLPRKERMKWIDLVAKQLEAESEASKGKKS